MISVVDKAIRGLNPSLFTYDTEYVILIIKRGTVLAVALPYQNLGNLHFPAMLLNSILCFSLFHLESGL